MSLGHKTGAQKQLGLDLVEDTWPEGQGSSGEVWPLLGDEAVPLRAQAERDLERERDERVRLVVSKGRRHSRRLLATVGIGVGAVLLAGLALRATARGGEGAPAELSPVAAERPARTVAHPKAPAHGPQLAVTRERSRAHRRSAAKAKGTATERRARRHPAHAKAAPHARPASQSPTPAEATAPVTASAEPAAPAPPPAAPEAPPPAPSSTGLSSAQQEFGFEH